MEFKIRPYHPSDLSRLYDICVQTGDCGRDVTHDYPDPDLFGQFYAAPYAVLEPDLCFVLTGDGVHMNLRGNEVMAKGILRAFKP